jgi:hypothetical protein
MFIICDEMKIDRFRCLEFTLFVSWNFSNMDSNVQFETTQLNK